MAPPIQPDEKPPQDVRLRALSGLRALGPWPDGGRVALACSGGADSTFLAWAWRESGAPAAQVWVCDHGHRDHSTRDAAEAAARYQALGFEARVLTAAAPPVVSENTLRTVRYAAFADAAKETGVDVVVTAHHADDLAETVLLRILRGTGLRGLAGIPQRRELAPDVGVELRRPLLGLRRTEIRATLAAHGIDWWDDPSNDDADAAARNRLRLELLPLMGQIATGDPVEAVLRLAAEAQEWQSAVVDLLDAAPDWRALPAHLRRESLARFLRDHEHTITRTRLSDLEGALLRKAHARVDDGFALSVRGGRLCVASEPV